MNGFRSDATETDLREACGVFVSVHAECGRYVAAPGQQHASERCGDSPIAREHGVADGFRCAKHVREGDCRFVRVCADGTVVS